MKKEREVYSSAKVAKAILDGQQPLRIDGDNFLSYVFENTPELEASLNGFFADDLVPCKTYADLIKSLQQQLYAVKKQRCQNGNHK